MGGGGVPGFFGGCSGIFRGVPGFSCVLECTVTFHCSGVRCSGVPGSTTCRDLFSYMQGYLFLSPNYCYEYMPESKECSSSFSYEYKNSMASFIPKLHTTKLFEAIFLLFDKTSSYFQYKIRWAKMRIKSEKN